MGSIHARYTNYTEEMYPLVATVLTLHSLQTDIEVIANPKVLVSGLCGKIARAIEYVS